ncbi:MAG: hypothetical protein K2P43_06930 [Lachnospiraceae bacterium]|nr:hypothetical protein [Lachnospiraceae bacterium]MDE6895900.1 hypothetical protein [Lachnospiraceae bacterium]
MCETDEGNKFAKYRIIIGFYETAIGAAEKNDTELWFFFMYSGKTEMAGYGGTI